MTSSLHNIFWLQRLFSFLFTLLLFLLTPVWAALFIPLAFLPRKYAVWCSRAWAQGASLGLKYICGVDYEVKGAHHKPQTPALYAIKHQSAWETILVLLLFHDPAIVLKKELLFIPFFNAALWRLQNIPLDRKGGRNALTKMVKVVKNRLENGRSIIIFPEGHRMPVGAAPAYQSGIAALYKALDVPVVPVALNSGLFWGRRSSYKKPGTITLEFLPAIEPGLDRKAFMMKLEDQIETCSHQLIQQAVTSPAFALSPDLFQDSRKDL